jgi:hypothetical protein
MEFENVNKRFDLLIVRLDVNLKDYFLKLVLSKILVVKRIIW